MKKGKAEKEEQTSRRQKASSAYLVAWGRESRERQKELLFDAFGSVFFGRRQASTEDELAALYRNRYGVDVAGDFCEGDEHYEEYQEAAQAIAEGMTVYGGEISFEHDALAELAEQIWKRMEEEDREGFRQINTMLEE